MNWKQRIERAIENDDHFDANDRECATTWTCCAVGEAYGDTFAFDFLLNKDKYELRRLHSLGLQFADCVTSDHPLTAKEHLEAIYHLVGKDVP